MTPGKQAAPSEWVERAMELADLIEYSANEPAIHPTTLAALRAHLDCKEREYLATKALVKQLAEALEELYYSNTYKAERMARAALEAQQQYAATQEKT